MAVHLDAEKLQRILCYEMNDSFEKIKNALRDLFTANGNLIPDLNTLLKLENHSDGSRITLHVLCGKVFFYSPYKLKYILIKLTIEFAIRLICNLLLTFRFQ